ncbi:MAG: chemotaxis protein CheD [Deltaproteobacteria bacterium]|nr:chemotaxis protein CheD [Deltaproteobacteria bacterium]
MKHVVHISDMKISKNPRDVLVTHSLGSCLGLAAYDPEVRVGALIHCLLPNHSGNPKARENPYMFVSSGVPAMIRKMYDYGAEKQRIILKAAGCGRMLNITNQFDTGEKNFSTLLKLLEVNDMPLAARDVGGSRPRTVVLHLENGRVVIRSRKEESDL